MERGARIPQLHENMQIILRLPSVYQISLTALLEFDDIRLNCLVSPERSRGTPAWRERVSTSRETNGVRIIQPQGIAL
jgi:hypothetical protein